MKITMLGGHSSGKTSYLGGLWATVKYAAPGAPVTLRGDLPASTTYLDLAEHALLGCESVDRTRRDTGERVLLDLSIDGEPFVFQTLDVAGETLEAMLEQRIASAALMEELAESDALMLFVHPDQVRGPSTIAEAMRLAAAAGEPVVSSRDTELLEPPPTDVDPLRVWVSAPTAVHLVDLIQIAVAARTSSTRARIAVIVSAWDTVDGPLWGMVARPREWLSSALPMFVQYMDANSDEFAWRAFGVSAQGCDFMDSAAVDALLALPYDRRPVVVTENDWTHDIAEPLRWLARAPE